jgi:hypothetical protein
MLFSEVQVLKLPEDDTKVSKHIGVNTVSIENTVIYICALVGCNKNNIKMHDPCIKMFHVILMRLITSF